jgi:hypothetical protein
MGEETMSSEKSGISSNSGGASGSRPLTVPQTPEEIFMQNLRAFRSYAGQRGAYFNEHGWLVYRGKVLTRSDSEYLDQSEVTRQRLLDEEELEAAWQNLLFYAGE